MQHALQDAQMILGILVFPVGRVTVDQRWWVSTSKEPVVADLGPEPEFAGSTKAGLQHWYGRIIGMHPLTSHHVPGQGRPAEIDILRGINFGQPVQREVVALSRHQHMGELASTGASATTSRARQDSLRRTCRTTLNDPGT